jgi:hypothetical protein
MAADCRHGRKIQFGWPVTVWPQPEHYRKWTCGPEPVTQLAQMSVRIRDFDPEPTRWTGRTVGGFIQDGSSRWGAALTDC